MERCLIFFSFATKGLNLQDKWFDRCYASKLFDNLIQFGGQRSLSVSDATKRFKACFRTDVAVCNVSKIL